MELVDYSSSIYSIIPALLAIILAIATRRVLVSLSAGIIVGALMLVDFNPLNALSYLKDNVVALVYSSEEGMNSNMNICWQVEPQSMKKANVCRRKRSIRQKPAMLYS